MKSSKKTIVTIGLWLLCIIGHLNDAQGQVLTVQVTQTQTTQPVVTVTQTSTTNVPAITNSPDVNPVDPPVVTVTSTSSRSVPVPTRSTAAATNTANNDLTNKSGATSTKTVIISGAVVGGVVILAFVGILLFRFHKNKDDWDDGGEVVLGNRAGDPFKVTLDQYHDHRTH